MSIHSPPAHFFDTAAGGSTVAFVRNRTTPVVEGRALDVWRQHRRFDDTIDAVCPDQCNEMVPHDPEVVRRLRALINAADPMDCAVIYVHRGYQPRYRTPLFQSLLSQLPKIGGQYSHRCADDTLPQEAYALIISCLTQFRDVIVVWDKVDRLLPAGGPDAVSTKGPLTQIYGVQSDNAGGFSPKSHITFYAPEPACACKGPSCPSFSTCEVSDNVAG
jgi:hypothetical protein